MVASHPGSARMIFLRRIWITIILLAVVFAVSCSLVYAHEDDSTAAATSTDEEAGDSSSNASDTSDSSSSSASPPKETSRPSSGNEDDWGSFYDPNNVFCGKFDCYKILGFDHETWGSDPPSLKAITKSYRNLSRKWHPDKNKAKGARERFVAIAKAYEILTNFEKRAEYDHFRDRPDEYYKKYGSSVLWAYAPKSDASMIIILFLIAGSAFTYYAQKNRWQTIANHLVKAATEDWSPREGGSKESTEIREKALAILAEKKNEQSRDIDTNETINGEKKKKVPKLTPREKKEKEWEELRPICIELVNKIHDFGAGFRKPTLHDLLVVRMVKWPYYVMNSTLWWSKYALRRLRKMEFNDEEREVLTKNAIGEVAWIAVSDEERANLLTLELWKSADALVEWKEEQEFKRAGLSATKMKQIKKMRKRGSLTEEEDLHMD